MKQLHGELAETEERKALEEAVSLYEKQMKAEQLMDLTQLDLIEEEENQVYEDPDDDNESTDNEHEDDEISDVIPEDAETAFSYDDGGQSSLANYRKSRSHNRSISELEPATTLPLSGDLTEGDNEDSVDIQDDIDNDIDERLIYENKENIDSNTNTNDVQQQQQQSYHSKIFANLSLSSDLDHDNPIDTNPIEYYK